jgi:KaiC/GvpD/RAD55 family RecA-like ATPase
MKTNDMNEEYYKFGKEKINIIMNSAELKIKGYKNASISKYTGLSNDGIKFIPTGLDTLDYAINTLQSKNTTLVTGKTAHGKTVFVSMVQNHAIDKGFKVLRVDGEHAYMNILNNTYRKLIGGTPEYFDLVKFGIRHVIEPKPHVLEALQKWHKDKLHLYVKGDSCLNSAEELFKQMKYIIQVEKIDLIILDNLMSLLDSSSSKDRNEKQGEFMKMCHNLAIACNVHIILVAHPKKTTDTKNQNSAILDAYQISGTSDLANLADNIISVEKVVEEDFSTSQLNGKIHLLKNRHYGEIKTVNVFFDKETTLFIEINEKTEQLETKKLSWRKYINKVENVVNPSFKEVPF